MLKPRRDMKALYKIEHRMQAQILRQPCFTAPVCSSACRRNSYYVRVGAHCQGRGWMNCHFLQWRMSLHISTQLAKDWWLRGGASIAMKGIQSSTSAVVDKSKHLDKPSSQLLWQLEWSSIITARLCCLVARDRHAFAKGVNMAKMPLVKAFLLLDKSILMPSHWQ